MPPILYQKRRREVANAPVLSPSQHNKRETELVATQKAPDPPRGGDAPGTRVARRQIYSVLTKRATRAVMALHQAGVVRMEHPQRVSSPRGSQLPWLERSNIRKRQPESYGTRNIIYPRGDSQAEAEMFAEMGL